MNNVKAIRDRLKLSQSALAEGIDCTQANVGHYERGQNVPSDAARRLIAFAKIKGLALSFDDVYGEVYTSDDASATGSNRTLRFDPNSLPAKAGA